MAGAGYKLFNTGDVLTAAQVNTYLQEQVVMVFADAAARTTALSGVLAEGMVSYLKSTDAVEIYNGSAWVGIAADQTPLTTKGDLFTYSTTDARLGVGSNGQVLTADSTTATGLKWAAVSSGKVVQIVTATYSTETTSTSSTLVTTGLNASITPTSASNSILVIVHQNGLARTATSATQCIRLELQRGTTGIARIGQSMGFTNSIINYYHGGTASITYLDSPATTSSTNYRTVFSQNSGSGTVSTQIDACVSTITLIEVAP